MSRAALGLGLGLGLLAFAWAAPLERWAGPFPAHMLRHMVLVALAPPLLLAGLPGLRAFGALPVALAAALEFVVVWGWHVPALHEAAYFSTPVFVAEQASFLLAGLVVWAAALSVPRLAGAGGMLLTSMHMTLLGALLILAPRALYAYCGLSQQQVGGMIMLALGTPAYLAAGLWLTSRALDGEAPA